MGKPQVKNAAYPFDRSTKDLDAAVRAIIVRFRRDHPDHDPFCIHIPLSDKEFAADLTHPIVSIDGVSVHRSAGFEDRKHCLVEGSLRREKMNIAFFGKLKVQMDLSERIKTFGHFIGKHPGRAGLIFVDYSEVEALSEEDLDWDRKVVVVIDGGLDKSNYNERIISGVVVQATIPQTTWAIMNAIAVLGV